MKNKLVKIEKIKEIYKIYDSLSLNEQKEVIQKIADYFSVSPLSVKNNWFQNHFRHIPKHKREETLKIMQKHKL